MKYTAPLFAFVALFIALGFLQVQAGTTGQYGQYGQYGGGAPSYSILVDKMVATGQKTKDGHDIFVDNLSPSDPRFTPETRVVFQIKVKNTSNVTVQNVTVRDVLPEYVDAVEGPGDYNPESRTISWTYAELKSGEERIERVVAQIKHQSGLPSDKGLMCMTNKAIVQVGDVSDEDTAQFCVEKTVTLTTKGGQPVTTTPEAGAPLLAFGALNAAALAFGIYLKKRA